MPRAGGAIQLANLPGSATRPISEATKARPLTLGRSDGAWVQVLSGLVAGDEYARANSFAVKAEIGKLGATHDH